ncbi:TIGR01906 family membrane protein [Arthrobacter livingstonensis]|uniref:TIGR01906 family membrane protein n=2 Tax=Arthrobacter livingstonensis TaxID=670078 RepID=A0A2V5LFB1_9MICC|nr:TIGR01906 family membrane protein [Arthrobacter livingstonensis]
MPKWPSEAESGSAAETGPTASTAAAKTEPAASSTPAAAASPSAAKAEPAATTAAAAVTAPSTQAAKPAPAAVSAPAAKPGPAAKAGPVAEAKPEVFVEQSPTTMLQVRPPQEEVDRRVAAREQAANTKPVLPRVFQVLLAVFYPVVLLVLAIRLVTTNAFLWVEYHRPGFPADSFGFSTDDRLTYGSYTVDYLLNFAGPRYLGGLVNDKGVPLFLEREVAHMADVKSLIDLAFLLGLVLAIVMVIGIIYLSRRSVGGVRRGLFAGSIATLVLIIALGVLALMGWETFFTDFHKVFFANGTWTFYTDDTLIRLFPSQFWSDGGIFIGAFVLVVSSLTLAFTWPTKDRRQAVTRAKRPGRRAAAQ